LILDRTIDLTARNLGELDVSLRPPQSNTVILLMDVGGSMEPFAATVSRLFTAACKATHFRDSGRTTSQLRLCRVYQERQLQRSDPRRSAVRRVDRRYKLIIVGDALMAPWELVSVSG
jgi:uncharacterized protein with von Willebrand factor type A (vWA) domain